MDEQERFAHFEKLGEAQVRDYALNWQGEQQAVAYKWLKQKREEQVRIENLRFEKNEALSRAAYRIAVIATFFGIGGVIVAVLAWLFPRS